MTIYNVAALVKGKDRALLERVVLEGALKEASLSVGTLNQPIGELSQPQRFNTACSSKALAGWAEVNGHAHLKEVLEVESSLNDTIQLLVDDRTINKLFAQTEEGKTLARAWKALVDGDLLELAKMNTYADSPLAEDVRRLFFKLVRDAGVQAGIDGSDRLAIKGRYRSSMNFSCGGKWLRVASRRDFDTELRPSIKTYLVRVAEGDLIDGHFQLRSEPLADEVAVTELHAEIADKLRKYYGFAQSVVAATRSCRLLCGKAMLDGAEIIHS